jgi:tetratricopeptide (TPR) repeat protein
LKPSNVLLAGDGQPMLLDFHLARAPVAPHSSAGDSLGGTRGYMSPEQAAAIGALRAGARVEAAVDARSDVYSLGRLLYELLGGPVGAADDRAPPITQFNRTVSRGLEDILAKCLSLDPRDRYPNAAALTEDLCRHLADLPLVGLPNSSLVERWQKWRRRKPQALKRLVAVAALIVACSAAGLYAVRRQANAAHAALDKAAESLARADYAGAIDRLRDGLEGLRYVPGQANLKRSLRDRLSAAQQLRLGADLHKLVDRLRFRDSGAALSATDAGEIDRGCSALWQDRERLLARFANSSDAAELRTDLLDLALLWASLKVRGAPDEHRNAARRDAIQLLAEAEQSLGSSVVLQHERQTYAAELAGNRPTPTPRAAHDKAPRNVWEHYALGRRLLHGGDLDAAAAEFQQALDQAPDSFWPNYYAGLCAYRREDYQQALNAFYACVALAPRSAECFYNRGLANAALEQLEPAIHDYSRALELDPALALAALHRGRLYLQLEDSTLAAADFAAALKHGADPADVYYQQALLHVSQHDRAAARADLHRALEHRPNDEDSLSLLRRLE